ncbi:MAG: class II aldolase/adducin family protein [Oscillospiraceae bacterium]|nr:class II aldolase/adducin family protein [Oscillospiraceae bacterium]
MTLHVLTRFSNRFGSDPELVLAGGGNTSAKDGNVMYVKGSGVSLASITAESFVAIDRSKLAAIFEKSYPESDAEREEMALRDLMDARLPGEERKRPSVETLLHGLFSQRFVLHLHPALVNGLTCSKDGAEAARRLFGESVLWIEPCKPGYILAKLCQSRMTGYKARTGQDVSVMLLENHGIFVAADSENGLDEILTHILKTIRAQIKSEPDFREQRMLAPETDIYVKRIAALYGGAAEALFNASNQAALLAKSRETAADLLLPFTPDHIVYCKAYPLFTDSPDALAAAWDGYISRYGYAPKIVIARGLGFFAVSDSAKTAETARTLFVDAIKIAVYAQSFGGTAHMPEELTEFIVNWEVESYRQKQNEG